MRTDKGQKEASLREKGSDKKGYMENGECCQRLGEGTLVEGARGLTNQKFLRGEE